MYLAAVFAIAFLGYGTAILKKKRSINPYVPNLLLYGYKLSNIVNTYKLPFVL